MPNYILFHFSLREKKWILRHPQHNAELRKRPYAVCGNPIPLHLPPYYLHFLSSFLFLSLLLYLFFPHGAENANSFKGVMGFCLPQ